jgi:hypothetical protein
MKLHKSFFITLILFVILITSFSRSYAEEYGSYKKPFAADSLWNSKPIKPVFGNFTIPTDQYFPSIHGGKLSTGCFLARASDSPMQIKGNNLDRGIYDADTESFSQELTLPHWPADLVPASGGDGHAEIIDEATETIHSFWQLRQVDGTWRATHHGWMPLKGSGWADPAHYHQGARATGVPPCAGIIRKHEVNDGDVIYHHALAMSLTKKILASNPAYVFPATIADRTAAKNTGSIPEGTLMMLPPDFDLGLIKTPELKKIANTLMVYGAYVVDENIGTPYVIYAEHGSGINIHKGLWNNAAARELQLIRERLRNVASTDGFLSADGRKFTPTKNLNILSMRGPWRVESGETPGKFVSLKQAVVFDNLKSVTIQSNETGRSTPDVIWARPHKGDRYKLAVSAQGGAMLNLKILDPDTRKLLYESGNISDGKSVSFDWPADKFKTKLTLTSGSEPTSSVSATLKKDE